MDGYTGDFIVAHHPVSPFELYVFGDISFLWDEERLARLRDYASRPGGWHVLEVQRGLVEREERLEEMVVQSRAPVLIITFIEGRLHAIRGLVPGPHAAPWAVLLPEAAAVDAIAGWSAATGGEADRAGIAALLAEEPVHFAEDLVDRLVDLLGLSEEVERWYPHEFIGWDEPVKLERSIAALQPGRFRALDCVEHQNCFALVRRRTEGDYLIEFREPKHAVLHQTVTPSLEKVVEAMNAWARGETLWREDFEWIQVAEQPE